MILKMMSRMITGVDFRLLMKFGYNAGFKGWKAANQFRKRVAQGINFPAFLFISVTGRCNLRCQGCWVSPGDPPVEMSLATLGNLISSAKQHGVTFFGILGGEPLMYNGLFDVLAKHPDCYFVIFTNGTLITPEIAARMRSLGNVSPLISVEGLETVSDERRGGKNVFAKTMEGLKNCRDSRLITGVATSVCKSNIRELVSDKFVKDLEGRGIHYLWYYIYRPSGPNPMPELALSAEEIAEVRRFIVDVRTRTPLLVIDAYWDHEGRPICPAALGLGYHISPRGDVEPCPPVQIAKDNVGDGTGVYDVIVNSRFLKDFKVGASGATKGCVLLEHPEFLTKLMAAHEAKDSSGRDAILKELAAMTPKPSHSMSGVTIPEKSWFYKFAKKNFFFGLGAYG
ncbi:MAG: radical SAM protein [Verrucomicrobia bacterium]|nr:radical SAM protein [Verrucomicrobiota bacterium]